MAVWGVCTVRDADDIIGPIVEHMLTQVDHVIVADNLSTDGTREILDALPIDVVDDNEPGHYQGDKMTFLARMAAGRGATWVVPFDADEFWYSPFGRIADVLTDVAPQWLVAEAALYDHVPTAIDTPLIDPTRRIGWRRRDPGPMPKVACRWRDDLRIDDGNHKAAYAGDPTILRELLVVRHFPYRTPEQFIHKARIGAAALNATGLPDSVGAHWRAYGLLSDEQLVDAFHEHFWSADPCADEGLIFDPCRSAL